MSTAPDYEARRFLLMISRNLLSEAQGIYPTVHGSENQVARALFLHSRIKIKQAKSMRHTS